MRYKLWQWRWYRKWKGGTWIYTDVREMHVGPFWQPLHYFELSRDWGMEREVGREEWRV